VALWLRLSRSPIHLRNCKEFWKGDLCSVALCYVRRVISIEVKRSEEHDLEENIFFLS